MLPGLTKTEILKCSISSINPDLSSADIERNFMGENRPSSLIYRLAKRHEVADVVTVLAGERAAVITDHRLNP